jgi:hypothetical protein
MPLLARIAVTLRVKSSAPHQTSDVPASSYVKPFGATAPLASSLNTASNDGERLHDLPFAQEFLGGISRKLLYDLMHRSLLKPIKIGRRTFVQQKELVAIARNGAPTMPQTRLSDIARSAVNARSDRGTRCELGGDEM